MLNVLIFHSFISVATVGFSQTEFTVEEGGTVTFDLVLTSGQLANGVTVTVTVLPMNDSATGNGANGYDRD